MDFRKSYQKVVDEYEIYAIILIVLFKITQTVVKAQYTTGGRLGVRLCQMLS